MSSRQEVHPLKVAGVVGFYMSAALIMVFVNKAVLNKSPDFPLSFLMNQLLIAVALLHGAAIASNKITIPKMDLEVAKKLFPVVAVNIIGLVFNTLCLRDVEASFFQIARGLQLPLTILVSALHAGRAPSALVILSATAVTFGFLLGVSPSLTADPSAAPPIPALHSTPSILSLFYGLLSSLFIALHAVLIKYSLPHCNNSTIELAWWTNAGSAIMLLPFVLLGGEASHMMELGLGWFSGEGRVFVWGSMITGVFGFLLCVAGLLSIKVTSPVTHMFSSAARSVLQTLLGVWLFNDLLTVNRAMSILVILLGTMYYTYVKSRESGPPPASTRPQSPGMQKARPDDLELGVKKETLFAVPEEEERSKN
ncbi:hypothetical protein JAAARDRAFT_29288 [Jaapia argillacea MUCL 33604]|uniref:GDP-mannose transporter n=1 Tax=Jaapia argillacea MUCL 33604 TaxID=933084 RepID=A0A067QAT3_9AGAM|nr:hypothetical protein JAAARDRAFT_29288 [Jaapia argillacea MUCL 33604]